MLFCSAKCVNLKCSRHHTKFDVKITSPNTYADFTRQCKDNGKFVSAEVYNSGDFPTICDKVIGVEKGVFDVDGTIEIYLYKGENNES